MNNNSNNTAKKGSKDERTPFFNDQLGENASEEYKSEEYSNAVQDKSKGKDIK